MAPDEVVIGERLGIGRTAEVFAVGDEQVAKVLRPGFPDGLGAAEAAAAALVGAAVAAAPRFYGHTRVAGRYALIYERVSGQSMLDRLSSRPWLVGRLARQFAALHVAMHASDGAGLPDHTGYYRAMIERAGSHLDLKARAAVLQRLAALPDGTAICHGDMHPGNVLMTTTGPVVIDWLTAGSGPPAADVARTLFLLRGAAIPTEIPAIQRVLIAQVRRWFAAGYLREYRRLGPLDEREVERWRLPILAARLGEEIEAERAPLLALIERELAASGQASTVRDGGSNRA
jgi:aminoglycoside phosphotransferase (APT) family kinase protein